MKLQDYLHYYIGSNVFLCYNLERNKVIEPLTYKMLHEDLDMFTDMDVSTNYKLLLRRLEDMTEGEALHLAGIYSGAEKIKRTTGTVSNFFYFFCEFRYGEKGVSELMVMHNGEAWYQSYFDKRPKRGKGHNIINQFAAAHYLLSKGFDLFGLIPANLAIDAKTITP